MSNKRERKDKEARFYMEYKQRLKQQDNINKKFEYLNDVDQQHLVAEYTLAQAKELCNILTRTTRTPFRALEAYFRDHLEELEDQFYITKNEYGEYIPDEERIEKLILPEPFDEEQDEIEKRASRLIDK